MMQSGDEAGLLALLLATGLAGGFGHCLGMCGPLVISYASAYRVGGITPHLLYGLGRITTYTLLGAAVGAIGSLIPIAAPTGIIQRWVMAGAGAIVALMGMGMAGRSPILRLIERVSPAMPLVNKARTLIQSGLTPGAYYPLGVVMGFIPCGLVYTALAASARAAMDTQGGTAGAIALGMALMAAFGLGTLPAMLMAGGAAGMISMKARGRLSIISAVLMTATGVMFIVKALW